MKTINKVRNIDNQAMKEIKEIAPILSSISKENPFKVPKGYFEQLEIRNHLSSANSQQVPAQYFENLQSRILESVEKSKSDIRKIEKRKTFSLFSPLSIGIAASICLAVMGILLQNNSINNKDILVTNDIETADLLAYIDMHKMDFGQEIYQLITEEEDFEELTNGISDDDLDIYINELDFEDIDTE